MKKLFSIGQTVTLMGTFFAVLSSLSVAQILPEDPLVPQIKSYAHNQGNIQIGMTNHGSIGGGKAIDPFTGERIAGIVYPKNSDLFYGDWRLWVGAQFGFDTRVSTSGFSSTPFPADEFFPDIAPFGECEFSSINAGNSFFSSTANSELDVTCVYFDTLSKAEYTSFDPDVNQVHEPLGLRVKQTTRAWSGANIDDFILITYELGNMGGKFLKDVYIGLYWESFVRHISEFNPIIADDLIGHLGEFRINESCELDTVDVAYVMDNDGNPNGTIWDNQSPRSAIGIRILGMPGDSSRINFNWWTSKKIDDTMLNPVGNWGPRRVGTDDDPFRKIGAGLGWPEGDRNRYYVMSHPEFDYDQMFMALDHRPTGWLPPPNLKNQLASGGFGSALISFGTFDLRPNAATTFTIALVAGDSVHVNPTDYAELWDPQNPERYYNSLDFSSLALNSRWASWVYDNPGIDTDGDGFFGKFRMCDGDTFWYEGDGVPDFRADVPPPSPEVTVIPSEAKLAVRWNGYFSETNVDPFTRTKDFEGYRVYLGLDDRASSLSIISSFDNLNYNRFRLIKRPNGRFDWVNNDLPFTIDSLKVLFNDQNFDPLMWTRTNPLTFNDTLFRFEKQDFNRSDLLSRSGIHKVFPNAIDPGPDTLLWNDSDLVFDHDRPLPKFYEYELIVDDLLPTVRQYVSVTAFDFGFSAGNIPAKESNKLNNITEAFARTDVDTVEAKNLDVYIYPNPYRIDGNYAQRGFENRDLTQANQRAHRVHFVNLPRVCKITIYSLDGDRIDSFEHNFPQGGPEAMHDEWDMITRNGLIPVSGIYYWVVEAETRTQMGKLIIIK